ncbi:M28 family metallopeptidase [Phenylobacterium sp.]|jgi:Zn-dependent M28 family amino/carboxypeptidase|uniref:M28 family metallopeptidase n=1 Tax=Phenylobacterium sp. TaxID=1871053 RepID=UPI002F42D129
MKMRILATAFVAVAGVAAAAPATAFDPVRLSAHIKVLASDDFQGRAPATPGETRTVAYLTGQFRAVGLQPGGDPQAGGRRAWTQDVPLARFEIEGPVAVSTTAGGRTQAWRQGEEVALRASAAGSGRVAIKAAPVVFVGYGVKAPERNWDDFKGVDLKGKIALVLVNDPDFETGPGTGNGGDFGGKAMTYYGRWTYKYEEAARQGALGVLVIHETAPASYGWATVKNSNTTAVFDIIREDPAKAHAPLEGWIQRDAAAGLMQAAGLDFETLKTQAQARDFRPATLAGVTFSADYRVAASRIVSKNVVGVLPGATRPDERVVYTAHWDHLGVGLPDARGDRIFNGAVDNADGVASLIELARAFGKAPRTDRSVMFLAVTAEERGLLGSQYYAAHPLYPLATTVADLNMDALAVGGPARDFGTSGEGGVTLQDDLIAVGRAHGRAFTPDPHPEAGHFFRSDHFPFAKAGVPAISFDSGEDLLQGGKAAGEAARADYVAERYHQPADEWRADWDLTGIAADLTLLYDLGRRLASSDEWPEWKAGSEFKAERDRTASARK